LGFYEFMLSIGATWYQIGLVLYNHIYIYIILVFSQFASWTLVCNGVVEFLILKWTFNSILNFLWGGLIEPLMCVF
jgi:hypothetical protein